MSEDTFDPQIHAWLDGRLSDEERLQLEARLKKDPKLAEQLADYQELGEALRADETPLPPGFHQRARARFESRDAQDSSREWFRLWSWESMGIAVAALLALALFVPEWGDGNSPLRDQPTAPAVAPASDREDALVAEELAAPPAAKVSSEASTEKEAPLEKSSALEQRAETAPAPAPAGAAPRKRSVAKDDSRQADAPADRDTDALEQHDDVAASAVTSQFAEAEPIPEALDDSAQEADETDEAEAMGAKAKADEPVAPTITDADREEALAKVLALGATAEPFSAYPIELPFIGKDEVLLLDDAEVLRRAKGTRTADAAPKPEATPKPTSPEEKEEQKAQRKKEKREKTRVRWLLIGPRDQPFACAGFKIASEGDIWVVGLTPLPAGAEPAKNGCLLTLPADAKEVRVTGP